MKIIPITTKRVERDPSQKIEQWIEESLEKSHDQMKEGDILVLSSKIVSYFEKNVIELKKVRVSKQAKDIGKRLNAKPELMQLALDQADEVIAETPWVLLTRKNGIYTANSGVDVSNVPPGYAVTWPKDPFASSSKIQQELMKQLKLKKLAVLIIDSACTPGRKGTVSLAIGYSGLKGYEDLKGSKDLYDNTLRYSALNIVDSLATAANLVMGESIESTPLAIIRDYDWKQVNDTKNDEMVISPSDEMFPLRNL